MSFVSLIGVELKKIRRSKILLILLIPVIVMWIPGIINADMNFDLRGIPITPENNFFIQGFMGMVSVLSANGSVWKSRGRRL